MSIDALIDSFVARFSAEAVAKLPPWMRPIVRKILDAFYALDFDAELKRLIDEWLKGDQSQPLVGYVLQRYPANRVAYASAREDGENPVAIDPFTILTLIQLAIRIISLFGVKSAGPESSEDSELASAVEGALAP